MQTAIRKVYLSILTSIMVLITVVATTYAWVGIFTYSSLEGFNINLKVDNNKSYNLLISADDITYGESVNLDSLQKQIMKNMGIIYDDGLFGSDADSVDRYFNRMVELKPVTTSVNSDTKELNEFYALEGKANPYLEKSNAYYKFDLFFTIEPREGIQTTTNLNANLFLSNIEDVLEGTICSGEFVNGNPFLSLPSEDIYEYPLLNNLPDLVTIDSSYACRIAFSIYDPILTSQNYDANSSINRTIIFQGGTNTPSLNNNVYSLGGILPEEYNAALKEYNSIYDTNLSIKDIDSSRLNDLELLPTNNQIWYSTNSFDSSDIDYFGVKNGVATKIKISVYFWFEGWDADCLRFIDKKNVTLNLKFSTDLN